MSVITLHYDVPGDDFTRAGEASGDVKAHLKKLGFSPEVIRNTVIALYEGEINMVIHAGGGRIDVDIEPDVALAMKEGYSTAPDNVRALGFGAGMGLPNIKKYTDEMLIDTLVGKGTTMRLKVYTNR